VRLSELRGRFLRIVSDPALQMVREVVEDRASAHGVMFLCPRCYGLNAGPVGTHSVVLWFADAGVPADYRPEPRWQATGSSIEDLTLSPSVSLEASCGWHGWVKDGGIA
jgi:hypothetical protein